MPAYTLLYVRSRQVKRLIADLRFYTWILLALIGALSYFSYLVFKEERSSLFPFILLLVSCFLLQVSRTDKQFLFLHVRNYKTEIFFEYLILTFPFAVSSLATPAWYFYPLFLLLLFPIASISYSFKRVTRLRKLSNFIPAKNFEWISGIRRMYPGLIILCLCALAFSWFRIAPLFFLFLITASFVSFYNECEPLDLLFASGKSSSDLLRTKIRTQAKMLLTAYLPVLIINLVFNPGDWLLIVLFLFMQVLLLSFAICQKYSNYRPMQMSSSNSVITSMVILSSVIPYLLPLPLLMTWRSYGRALTNLDYYFHDTDR